MNLYTAKLLMPVQKRLDEKHGRLSWMPSGLYETIIRSTRAFLR